MNEYLYSEPPKSFAPTLAKVLKSVEKAVILQQIHFWLFENQRKKSKAHFHEGHYWTWNSYKEWQKDLDFIPLSTLRRHINEMEKLGLIISSEFNRNRGDRTKWYRIDYELLHYFTSAQNDIPSAQNDIPSAQNDIPCAQNDTPCAQNGPLIQSDLQSDLQSDQINTPLTPQGESCAIANQIPFSDWEEEPVLESPSYFEEINKPWTLAKISSEIQISPAARKKAKLEARAKQFEPLRIVYNQNKPDAWCRCDSLNEARCNALQRLVDEWGDRTIEKLTLACQYGSVSAWHRDKNWTIDNLTRKGVVTELAEKAIHSLPKQAIKDRTYAEEYQRIFEGLESRRLAKQTGATA